jgi:hypothetical protein
VTVRRQPEKALAVAGAVAALAAVLVAPTSAAQGAARVPAAAHVAHTQRLTAPPRWRSGVFAGFSARRDIAFGAWRGSPITSATDFQSGLSWPALENSRRLILTWQHEHRGIKLSIGVPLWPGIGDHMQAAAGGAYDDRFRRMAAGLVSAGLGHAILRLGWEFNGRWFAWGITHPHLAAEPAATRAHNRAQRARQFATAWRHIVRAIRTVPGQHFTFDWCVSAGPHYRHVELAYPGDRYVDYIGDDVYDWNRAGYARPAQRWNAIVHERTGLAWQRRFAAAHHKPMSYPEWALVWSLFTPGQSGNDDPSFLRHMYRWFRHHDVAYENYFDYDVSLLLNSGITTSNGRFVTARELYRRLWGRLAD